jgi:hypothetical protein
LDRGEKRGVVFTANYDLLLYWVVVRHSAALGCHDGFDQEGYWSGTPSGAQVFYLHGGLHLFERAATEMLCPDFRSSFTSVTGC